MVIDVYFLYPPECIFLSFGKSPGAKCWENASVIFFFMRKGYLRLCHLVTEEERQKVMKARGGAHPILIPLDENLEGATPRGECGCAFRQHLWSHSGPCHNGNARDNTDRNLLLSEMVGASVIY